MEKISLEKGIVIVDSRNRGGVQDHLEIRTTEGRSIILTATANGKIRVGIKPDKSYNNLK